MINGRQIKVVFLSFHIHFSINTKRKSLRNIYTLGMVYNKAVESAIKSQLTYGNPVGFPRQKTFRRGLSLPPLGSSHPKTLHS